MQPAAHHQYRVEPHANNENFGAGSTFIIGDAKWFATPPGGSWDDLAGLQGAPCTGPR